ncbi:MAG: hypothetical protein AAGI01_11445 [Myxococcota bacterium]
MSEQAHFGELRSWCASRDTPAAVREAMVVWHATSLWGRLEEREAVLEYVRHHMGEGADTVRWCLEGFEALWERVVEHQRPTMLQEKWGIGAPLSHADVRCWVAGMVWALGHGGGEHGMWVRVHRDEFSTCVEWDGRELKPREMLRAMRAMLHHTSSRSVVQERVEVALPSAPLVHRFELKHCSPKVPAHRDPPLAWAKGAGYWAGPLDPLRVTQRERALMLPRRST